MARRNIIEYSEDKELHEQATSPPASPVKIKGGAVANDSDQSDADARDGSDEDEDASMADFIDDRALDELSEHSESAEEGFSGVDDVDRTPPVTPRPKKQYPVDSDNEGVKQADDFEADVVESPKKRRSVNAGARLSKRQDADDEPEGDSGDDMNVSPPSKVVPSTPSRRVLVVHDSDSESVQEVETPEGTTKSAPKKQTPASNKSSTPAQSKKTTTKKTPVSRKKVVKSKEILSDTDNDAILALKLDKDDGMYPERKPSKVQSTNFKRALPITPPLATRSSAKVAQIATPSKRQRTDDQVVRNKDEDAHAKKSGRVSGTKKPVEDVDNSTVGSEDNDEHAVTRTSPKKTSSRGGTKKQVEEDEDEDGGVEEHDNDEDEASVKVTDAKPRTRAKGSQQKLSAHSKSKPSVLNKQMPNDDREDGPGDKAETEDEAEAEDEDEAEAKAEDEDEVDEVTQAMSPKKRTSASTRFKVAMTDDSIDVAETPKASSQKATRAISSRSKGSIRDNQDEDIKADASVPKPAPAAASKSRRGRTAEQADEEAAEKTSASPKKVAARARTKTEDDSDPFNPPASEKRRQAASSSSSTTKVKDEPEPTPSLFEPLQPKRAPGAAIKQTYSSKLWVSLPPPETCDMYDINLLDKALSSLKSYIGLENLRFCDLISAGQLFTGIETGRIRFSAWKDHLSPEMFSIVASLIGFQSDGRYVNLSRISPAEIAARYMTDTRHEITKDGRTAICIATGAVRESALIVDLGTSFPYHALRIVLHSYEHERFAGSLGEISRHSSLVTQIWNSAITFGTKTQNTKTAKADLLPSSFYNSYQSPKKKRGVAASSLPDHIGALEYDDTIPVYDARNLEKGFKWNSTVFANPAHYFPLFPFSEFPEFRGEIPPNSLVTVGFVTQIYRMPDSAGAKGGKGKGKAKEEVEPAELRVNMMIRFVFVLAVIN